MSTKKREEKNFWDLARAQQPQFLIKLHENLLVVDSLSCNDVVVAEVVEIEVLVKDLEDLGWLVGAVGARHVDARVDQVELVVAATESAFLHDFFLRDGVQVVLCGMNCLG